MSMSGIIWMSLLLLRMNGDVLRMIECGFQKGKATGKRRGNVFSLYGTYGGVFTPAFPKNRQERTLMQPRKNIQIEQTLFIDLVVYALERADSYDERYRRIENGVKKKLNADFRRDLYTKYKTGESKEAREQARQKYLEEKGIPLSFQWEAEQDINVTHIPS